jgi:hypothetical protein
VNESTLQPNEIGGGPAAVNVPMDIESNFYRTTLTCDKNCMTCTICSDYWTEKISDNG